VADEVGALQAQLRILSDEANSGALNSDESALKSAKRELVECFLVRVMRGGKMTEDFDETSAVDASEALRLFTEMIESEITRVKKRLESLQHQLQTKGASSASRKEAVALLPTSYLQGLLNHHHFVQQAAGEVAKGGVACAEEVTAAATRGNSILPLPAMARRMMGEKDGGEDGDPKKDSTERPHPTRVAQTSFHQFMAAAVKSIGAEFTRVELPLGMSVDDLDAAEARRYPPMDTGVVGPSGAPTMASTINAKSHTSLTKSIQLVVLKEGQPIADVRPISTLQLVGEKYYEGTSSPSGYGVSRRNKDDPLAAFGFHDDGSGGRGGLVLKPKYRFHLLPFPNLHPVSEGGPSEVGVDTVAIFGRNAEQSTIVTEHPSCSGQHLALFWTLAFTKNPSPPVNYRPSSLPLSVWDTQWFLELQMCDLGASNGTGLLGGDGSTTLLPKAHVGLAEVPTPQLTSPQSLVSATVGGPAVATKSVVIRAACPMQRVQGGDFSTFTYPSDVGFGPLGTAGYALLDGDQIAIGASTRRYVVVHDDEGVVSGQ